MWRAVFLVLQDGWDATLKVGLILALLLGAIVAIAIAVGPWVAAAPLGIATIAALARRIGSKAR